MRKDHWVFASYAWNESQSDATVASEDGIANITEVDNNKRHSIPSVSECRSCHDSGRTEILGFTALQLSTDRDPNALHGEPLTSGMVTLKTPSDANLLAPAGPDLVANPPRIEATSPIARTALGYLSTNCGNCHNRDSSIASLGLDLKHDVTQRAGCTPALLTTIGKRGHWVVPDAQEESRIINPGRADSSALVRRMKSRRPIYVLGAGQSGGMEGAGRALRRVAGGSIPVRSSSAAAR
ncbi:MAG: hypothetical protein K2Y23_01055 [Cyanobacteria bacterium]|nr:hypothetical protein [Cyanobacteriota bacterium]